MASSSSAAAAAFATSEISTPSTISEATRYKLKRGKLIFLNQRTGDLHISPSAVPRQNCICTICTCGRHHCPEYWKPHLAETEISEYQQNYINHPAGFHRDGYFKEKPDVYATTAGPDHFLTSHQREYIPFPIRRRDPSSTAQPQTQYKRIPFEGNSTHRIEFTGKQPPEKTKSAKLVETLPPKVCFGGSSLNHEDYANWYKQGKIPRVARSDYRGKVLRNYPFQANSVYRASYLPIKGNHSATKITPIHDLPNSKDPFPYESEYDLNYKEKALRLCPVLGLPKWKASEVTGHIHYVKDKEPSPKSAVPFSPAKAKLASHFAVEPLPKGGPSTSTKA